MFENRSNFEGWYLILVGYKKGVVVMQVSSMPERVDTDVIFKSRNTIGQKEEFLLKICWLWKSFWSSS